jgi:secreted protein with Ig-like and vWFA domain
VGARIEQSVHPVLQQRNLLRIAVKVSATGRGAGQPLRLTVLLDTSGSMERDDRRLAVRRALEELIALLGPNDRVTLIGFARQPRLLAEAVPGNQAGHLVELSARTPAEGGTNLEQALTLAGELARRHRVDGAQNRIVLLTDGAANLGNADPAQLSAVVERLRQQGVAFDACGIGLEGVGDTVLEALTRKGDGRYHVMSRPESADAAFARQLAGAFRPAAEDVKLQVRFNPGRVGHYRLIGFEQHRLRAEDFRNDTVDAAELAAEEGATALYQVEILPEGSGEVGEVYVRFRDAATGGMVERSWTIRHDSQAPRFDRAAPSLQLAGVAALVAEKLGETPLAQQFKLGEFAGVVNTVRGHYAHEARVQELAMLYGRLRRISGE